MSDQTGDDNTEYSRHDSRSGFRGADVLAVLAISSLLAAIGLITFFLTTALAN